MNDDLDAVGLHQGEGEELAANEVQQGKQGAAAASPSVSSLKSGTPGVKAKARSGKPFDVAAAGEDPMGYALESGIKVQPRGMMNRAWTGGK